MENVKISTRKLNLYYGTNHALKDIDMDIRPNAITAFIGPSGCGKSTFLKTLNRMNDLIDGVKIEGEVTIDGENIYDEKVDTTLLRKKVGMVFQQPNPFPMSIYDNIAYGPRIHGIKNKSQLDQIVEESLKGAAIRGQGPPEKIRPRPFRRPAAETLHRESPCRTARGASHGRAHLRSRPHFHPEDRGSDGGAEKEIHGRRRHP